jgi:hypothetical protein
MSSAISISLGTVFGVATLVLADKNPIWAWLDVPIDLRAPLSSALSIFFLLFGFLYGLISHQQEVKAELIDLAKDIRHDIPDATLFSVYDGADAFRRISNRLSDVQSALNTRIFQDDYSPDHAGFGQWDRSLRIAIKRGLNYSEVMSVGNLRVARSRAAAAVGSKGHYRASIISFALPSFCNFVVFRDADGSREVWFGWLIAHGAGFEMVVRTSESHVVDLFEQWHRDLYGFGDEVTGTP